MKKIIVIIICILSVFALMAQDPEYIPNLQVETLHVFDTVNMDGGRITNMADAIDSSDAVTYRQLLNNTSALDSNAVRVISAEMINDSSLIQFNDTIPGTGKIATKSELEVVSDSLGYFTRKTSGFMGIVSVSTSGISVSYPGHMARSDYYMNILAWYDIVDSNGDTISISNEIKNFRKDSLGFICNLKVSDGWLQYQTFDTTGVTLSTGGTVETDPIFAASVAKDISVVDTTYWGSKLSSYIETDPVVKAITGIIKSNGSVLSAASAGTDYQAVLVSGTTLKTVNSSSLLGSGDITITPMIYPGSGIPLSTGSAWGTSYTTSGSGVSLALTNSPSFTTPTLGVASATSINKVTITAPATSSVLTISNGKTFTSSNTLTLSGTDGSTLNIGTGGTLGTAAYTASTDYLSSTAISDHAALQTGVHGLSITAAKTLTVQKSMNFTSSDDVGVYTFPTGTKTLLSTDGSAANLTSFPTLNQNTTGSSASCTGNAATATKLAATKTINGVAFDGSANITVPSNITPSTSGNLMISNGTVWTSSAVPIWNQNTTGSAASWTTARNLAGNSVTGAANVAFSNKFIVQGTSDAGLSGAQFLGSLGTGIVKNTTTTGILSIASAGTDYIIPGGTLGTPSSGTLTNCTFPTLNQATTNSAGSLKSTATTGLATVTGMGAGTTRVYTLPDANATILYSGGALGTPSSGILTNCTFPTLNQNTTGTASNVTGTVAILNGGTGQTTAQAAMNSLAGAVTSTYYLRGNGTNIVMSAIQATDVPTLNQNTTGSAATLTTTRAIYGNNFDGSAALTQIIASTYGGTGNGFTKFSGATVSEKTYTLPNANATILYSGGDAGTPSAIVLTNASGTASVNINGTVGATTPSTVVAKSFGTVSTTLTFNATSTTMNYSTSCDGYVALTNNITGAITLSNVPDNGSGTIFCYCSGGAYGVATVVQSGLTTVYGRSGKAPTATNLSPTSGGYIVICYKRNGSILFVNSDFYKSL